MLCGFRNGLNGFSGEFAEFGGDSAELSGGIRVSGEVTDFI